MAVNTIDAQAVLAQMRALATQAHASELRPSATPTTDFSAALKAAINLVNDQQQQAAVLTDRFERGVAGVDIAQVMVSIQKANLSFQAATQVRNRLVSAYQDIMNMPL